MEYGSKERRECLDAKKEFNFWEHDLAEVEKEVYSYLDATFDNATNIGTKRIPMQKIEEYKAACEKVQGRFDGFSGVLYCDANSNLTSRDSFDTVYDNFAICFPPVGCSNYTTAAWIRETDAALHENCTVEMTNFANSPQHSITTLSLASHPGLSNILKLIAAMSSAIIALVLVQHCRKRSKRRRRYIDETLDEEHDTLELREIN